LTKLILDSLIEDLQKKLSYGFKNPELIREALTHKSFVNENPDLTLRDNERFEFLGDAVLDLAISTYLIKTFPDLQEGD